MAAGKRVAPWFIVPCPVCKAQAGAFCKADDSNRMRRGNSHANRNRDGYKLHAIWEAAGAEPMLEDVPESAYR
jgi:hypothetical protein